MFLAAQTGLEAYSAFRIMRTGSFLVVKQPERGADHQPHSSAGLRMGCRLRLKCDGTRAETRFRL